MDSNRELRLADLRECHENCKRFVCENSHLLTARSKSDALTAKLKLQLAALEKANAKLRSQLAEDDRAIPD